MPYKRNQGPNTSRRARLVGFDYHTPGYYFVTICQQSRCHFFGQVIDHAFVPSASGLMISSTVEEVERRFPNVRVDSYVVMPNHVHLLVGLNLDDSFQGQPDSLIEVIHWWKTVTTNRYISGVKRPGWPRFDGSLWRTGYHDRIVRDDRELDMIKTYIVENPQRWEADTFYGTRL